MRAAPLLLASLLTLLLLGCETRPAPLHRVTCAPDLVPTTALTARSTSAWDVLPGSDAEYVFLRGEKTAFGPTSMGDVSAYTIYTYDAQAIGIPRTGGFGYRYRWTVQQGASSP